MSWLDVMWLARRSLWRRRGRNALTGAGISLGAALLIALGVITNAADTKVIERLGHGGPIALVKVRAAQPQLNQLESDNFQVAAPRNLGDPELTRIRQASHVRSVVPVLASPVLVLPPTGPDFFGTAVGTDLSASILPVTLLVGRLPVPHSLTEVAVSSGYLDRLHLDPGHAGLVLGQELEFAAPKFEPSGSVRVRGRWSRAVIVGVVAQDVGDGDFVVSLEQAQSDREWALTGVGDQDLPLPTSPYTGALVLADSLDDVHGVREEITDIGFATSAPEHLVASVRKYLGIVDVVLGAIGLVALAIALLSIANSLIAALHERRRDIGVLKAIGGRDLDVLRWFLLEAALLGTAGGLAGAVIGVGIAEAVGLAANHYLVSEHLEPVDLIGIPVLIPLLGFVGSALLAAAAAAPPALAAARVAPREAVAE